MSLFRFRKAGPKAKAGAYGLLAAGVLSLTLSLITALPAQAAFEPVRGNGYDGTREETENINVYQQNAAAVVSVSNGKNQGAGVLLSSEGLIVTSRHVIQDAKLVTVHLADGPEYAAQLVSMEGFDHDLAFLRIKSSGRRFPSVQMGDSGAVRVGQRVLAIGSPFGLDGTLTSGIISRIDHTRNVLQTDAAINPGNSGGALFNTHGELIGINRSIVNPAGASSSGISFAVPVNVVRDDLALLSNGRTTVAKLSQP